MHIDAKITIPVINNELTHEEVARKWNEYLQGRPIGDSDVTVMLSMIGLLVEGQ